jgi:uncharacterized membrane protein YfcA
VITLETTQWVLAIAGALCIGLSKGGVAGLGILVAAIFAGNVLPAKEASGFVLPMLVVGDLVSIGMYRRHGRWVHLWRLLPWTVVGVGAGYVALGRMNDAQARIMVGAIIVALVIGHFAWRRWMQAPDAGEEGASQGAWMASVAGLLAGFTTLVANAAGPVMIVYLLAMRLPKMEFLGTSAWFFLLLNLFKVPFMAHLGLVTPASLLGNAVLVPAVVVGAFAGRWLAGRLNQRAFEVVALVLAAAAGVKLLAG